MCRWIASGSTILLIAFSLSGCSKPEKNVDPDEAKKQIKALKGDLNKENAPAP